MERKEEVYPFIKVAVVGAKRVGKTSLIERLCSKPFPSDESYSHTDKPASQITVIAADTNGDDGNLLSQHDQTLQVKFVECPYEADDETKRQVLEESFVTLLAYDITDRYSLDEVMKRWYPALYAFSPESFKMLVGCKVDMVSERCVDLSDMSEMPKMFMIETSAADRTNVDLLANILHIRACHMIQKAKYREEAQDYYERVHDSDASFQKMYGGPSNRACVDEAQVIEDLQRVTRLGESGTTIQDILNSMPFSLKKAGGFHEEEKPFPKEEALSQDQTMSPLGKAIDSMVERLEAAKIQGGLSRDTEVQSSKNEKAGTDIQKAVGDLTRTYNDLQKSFALCGIAIDPPFPSLHTLESNTVIEDELGRPAESKTPENKSTPVSSPGVVHPLNSTSTVEHEPVVPKTISELGRVQEELLVGSGSYNVLPGPDQRSTKPPETFVSRHKAKERREPLNNRDVIVVSIKLAGDREAQIRVQEGDDPLQLAREFISRENLRDDDARVQRLTNLIDEKIQQHMKPSGSVTREQLRSAFLAFDKDNDKMITRTQLIGLLSSLKISIPNRDKIVQDYFTARNPKTAIPSLLDLNTFEDYSAELFHLPPDNTDAEQKLASANSSLNSYFSRQSSVPSNNRVEPKRANSTSGSVHSLGSTGNRRKLIAELDIQLGTSGKTGKILVRRGDDGQELVTNFCRRYPGQLTARQAQSLVVQLNRKLYPQGNGSRS